MNIRIHLLTVLIATWLGAAHGQPQPDTPLPQVPNAWEFADGGAKLILKFNGAGVSGYFVHRLGLKAWDVKGTLNSEGELQLTRYVPVDEWTTAPAPVIEAALREVGSDRPGFMNSRVYLKFDAEARILTGYYARDIVRYQDETFIGTSQKLEDLRLVPIDDPQEALLWTLIGLGLLAGLLSLGLDLIPGVGTIKGLHEASTGRDMITGAELTPLERTLGAVPLAGPLLGTMAGLRMLRHTDELAEAASQVMRHGDEVVDTARAGTRHGDEIVEAATNRPNLGPDPRAFEGNEVPVTRRPRQGEAAVDNAGGPARADDGARHADSTEDYLEAERRRYQGQEEDLVPLGARQEAREIGAHRAGEPRGAARSHGNHGNDSSNIPGSSAGHGQTGHGSPDTPSGRGGSGGRSSDAGGSRGSGRDRRPDGSGRQDEFERLDNTRGQPDPDYPTEPGIQSELAGQLGRDTERFRNIRREVSFDIHGHEIIDDLENLSPKQRAERFGQDVRGWHASDMRRQPDEVLDNAYSGLPEAEQAHFRQRMRNDIGVDRGPGQMTAEDWARVRAEDAARQGTGTGRNSLLSDLAERNRSRIGSNVSDALRGSTRPDFVLDEIQAGERVGIAAELKVPRSDQTVGDFLRANRGSLNDQAAIRGMQIPRGGEAGSEVLRNELWFDVRAAGESERAAAEQFAHAMRQEGNALGPVRETYENVRFITGSRNEPVISDPIAIESLMTE